jgi:hypothetical protein
MFAPEFLFHASTNNMVQNTLFLISFLTLYSCLPRASNLNYNLSEKNSQHSKNYPWLTNEGKSLTETLQTKESSSALQQYLNLYEEFEKQKKKNPALNLKDWMPKNILILAGKHLFIYGTPTSKAAVPESFVKAAQIAWPNLVGPSFQHAGLIPNPDDPGFPVGIPSVKAENIVANTIALGKTRLPASCAQCHFGMLPDGETYSFGMSNDNIRFGRLATVFTYPIWGVSQKPNDPSLWHPEVSSKFQTMRSDAQRASVENKAALGAVFSDLSKLPSYIPITHFISSIASIPNVGLEDQRDFLFDTAGRGPAFYIALGTKERLVLSTPTLWGIFSERNNNDINSSRLGGFVHSPDLETHIIESLFVLSGGKKYTTDKWVVPISEFIRTFQAPKFGGKKNEALFEKGERAFNSKERHCSSCHNGADGGSGMLVPAKAMKLDERYTAPYIKRASPSNSTAEENISLIRELFKNLHKGLDWSQEGVRVRRIRGAWARSHLMSNGAIRGLDHAFCLGQETVRAHNTEETDLSELVHSDLCKGTEEERMALREYVRHF